MNKILLLFAFITIGSIEVKAQEWEYVTSSKKDEVYIKKQSFNSAWVKFISNKTQYYHSGSKTVKTIDGYSLSLYKFDCSKSKLGIIESIIYDKSGTALKTTNYEDDLQMIHVIPDSVGEGIFTSFCIKK